VANKYQFVIKELGFDIDHVHLIVDLTNKYSACQVSRLLKGVSSRKLFKEFLWLRKKYFWGGHLWSPAYYFDSVGRTTYETMSNYVKKQEEKGNFQRKLSEFIMPPTSVAVVDIYLSQVLNIHYQKVINHF